MTTSVTTARLRRLVGLQTIAWVLLLGGREVSATTLAVRPASAAPGAAADVCVTMSGGGKRVAGLQMSLRWDGNCVTAKDSGQCRANPATNKKTMVGKGTCGSDANCLTTFLFSITDRSPIPDGELFCCNLSLVSAPTGDHCSIRLTDVILSDPVGGRIADVTAQDGTIEVKGAKAAKTTKSQAAKPQAKKAKRK